MLTGNGLLTHEVAVEAYYVECLGRICIFIKVLNFPITSKRRRPSQNFEIDFLLCQTSIQRV
jgi:hypothetical protein